MADILDDNIENDLSYLFEKIITEINNELSNGNFSNNVDYYEIITFIGPNHTSYPKIDKKIVRENSVEITDYSLFFKKISNDPSYQSCREKMVKRTNMSHEKADEYLSQFINTLSMRLLNNLFLRFDEITFKNILEIFLNEIDNKSIPYHFKLFLSGVELSDNIYEINNSKYSKITLKRPKPGDIQIKRKYISDTMFDSGDLPQDTTAILEYTYPCKSTREAQIEEEAFYNILLLFKLSSLVKLKEEFSIDITFTPYRSFHLSGYSKYRYVDNIRNTIGAEDLDLLNSFIEAIHDDIYHIVSEDLTQDESPEYLYLKFAFQMYKEALLQFIDIKIKIAFLVTAIETLYKIKNEKRTRPTYKAVSERMLNLFEIYGIRDSKLMDTINDAYKIRDTVYHGFIIDKKIKQSDFELYRAMLDYTRLSLQIFIQIKADKISIIQELDSMNNATMKECAKQKLIRLTSNNIFITNISNRSRS